MGKTYSIIGQKHRDLDAYLVGITPGTPVTLVREPGNKFDKNAVAVWINGQKVGFIPMKQNPPLAIFIDQVGREWTGPSIPGASMALDEHETQGAKALEAKFIRSPNSSYPMVEVD